MSASAGAMNAKDGGRPRVTVIMTGRERNGLALRSVESVLDNTRMPFRFLYADVCSPDWLRARLSQQAKAGALELVRFDEPLWPTQVRHRLVGQVDSAYAVYIDNDVLVAPGWLESMIACADETGAGIVGPVYLWGEDASSDLIHMAGGLLRAERQAAGIVLREGHRFFNRRLGDVTLKREECGFAEFHCMLMRREVYRLPEIFHPEIVSVHEHIHASLVARENGYKTFVEPQARVTYLAYAPYCLSDVPVFRRRWSLQASESSIAGFARRWGVIDDDRSFGSLRAYLASHRAAVDPVRPRRDDAAPRPMQEHDLKQTLTGLRELALLRGYSAQEIEQIGKSHWAALLLSNGGYRPCGRPFIDHLVGTASVLVHHGFQLRLIQAALLHAAYTHAPGVAGGPEHTIDAVAQLLGGHDSPIERLVRAYAFRAQRWSKLLRETNWADMATVDDVDIALIAIANSVDMHLSGEIRATGRSDPDDAIALSRADAICEILDVSDLAETRKLAQQGFAGQALPKEGRRTTSFRVVGTKIVPMVNAALFEIEREKAARAGPSGSGSASEAEARVPAA